MENSVKLGRLWGIPVGLHWSMFLVFGLVTWSLAAGYFPEEYPTLSAPVYWLLGLITSAIFFGSILAHELGHAIIARRNEVPVRGITLFIFGGVAQLEQEARSPGAEFRIAIAGPLVSLALAGLFELLWLLDQSVPFLAAPSIWLARINLLLAAFNMIPGFPLDGGRVLRAIVWKWTGSLTRATRVAAFTGQVAAFGFIGWGVFIMINDAFFNGLWLVFIGWFLQNAAAASYAHTNLQHLLQGVTVEQVMGRSYQKISGLVPLNRLVEDNILAGGGQRYFFVGENGQVRGMLTLKDVTAVPQRKWPYVTAEQVMIPLKRLVQAQPEMELLAALQMMDNAQVAQVPVTRADEVVGVLSREQILHYLRTRAELGV